MAHLQKFEHNLIEIKALIAKLESGDLQLSELESLVSNAQELYQLAIVLRFKAYEEMVARVQDLPLPTEETLAVDPEPIDLSIMDNSLSAVTNDVEEVIQPSLEFNLFDEPVSAVALNRDVSEQDETAKLNPVTDTDDFIRRFASFDPALKSQLAMSRLDTLIGSFGLNERLQFINELFDGSSEAFSEAIKSIDNQRDEQSALQTASAFATQFNWDNSSDTVEDFVLKIRRRYA